MAGRPGPGQPRSRTTIRVDGETGRSAIIEQFLADGIDHMFGNPGTVEQGFLDALGDHPDMKYVLTLHETVAVMIGDGYARARHKTALVQIHSTPGLGNAIGALYQANRGHSPLVVIGGDAGLRYVPMEAQMSGDLVGMARPVTKWATRVVDPGPCCASCAGRSRSRAPHRPARSSSRSRPTSSTRRTSRRSSDRRPR